MKTNRFQNISILSIIGFSVIIIGITVFMTLKNTADLMGILEDSIESQLISISIAARERLDVVKFDSYNVMEDTDGDGEAYRQTLENLRSLQKQVGAKYIYALKQVDGKYLFIFDTDEEEDTRFQEYELSPVHRRAFQGKDSAGIMNVQDEYGNFNTGAVPIWKNDQIIGIICTDIEDAYIQKSDGASFGNAVTLVLTLFATMCAMTIIVSLLLYRVRKMQDKLFRMANYDALTNMPNRHFLMTYLPDIAEKALKKRTSFALLLIDLDNFKTVNDHAGHDAGDELLRHIGAYLNGVHGDAKSFRPSAGILNVSARIGGDEFVQIVPGVATEAEARAAAEKVLDNFRTKTLDRFVEKYRVGLSIGVALFPYHTENFNVLIKYADMAMYHAKRGGKNAYCIYNDEMSREEPDADSQRQDAPRHERRQYRG